MQMMAWRAGKCCAIGGFTVFCRFTHLRHFADRSVFHQLALADERDWPLAALALGFSLYAGVKVVVSLLTGPLIDRFSARRLLPVSAVPLMLALSLLVFFDNLFGSYTPHVYMCLIGMNLGLGAP